MRFGCFGAYVMFFRCCSSAVCVTAFFRVQVYGRVWECGGLKVSICDDCFEYCDALSDVGLC